MIKTTKTNYCPKKTPRFTLCVHDKNVMRQRTTGAPKPEKNKNIFHNTCTGKQTALQDQRIYKRASISIVAPTSRSRGCNSGSERAEEKRSELKFCTV